MKILFLCGSLAPGCDGVGDYTRRLVGELIRQGHQASIIALNDRLIDSLIETSQKTDGIAVPVLRLPSIMSTKERFEKAECYINDFNPEWLSLQYVPFSFHDKGLPFGLGTRLAKIGIGRRWHVMFHELWVGIDKESSYKHKLWGQLQKKIINGLLHSLKPIRINTQSSLNKRQIEKFGNSVEILPLFGNVPVKFKKHEVISRKSLSLVLFGTIHPKTPIKEFICEIKSISNVYEKKIVITFIGRNGVELKLWENICKQNDIDTIALGELQPEEISWQLSKSDIGISTTPYPQTEKSGVVATYRDHGLPIIIVARKWTPIKIEIPKLPDFFFQFKIDEMNNLFSIMNENVTSNNLKEVTVKFCNSLIK
jgi:hypothetical protein